ncbi:hypothetical protein HY085_03415 [Candidatus Gottesmanbacteria bacterium]|nr:hypothetical protein [Candidatus Gottesmanbacteria bacterium]
MNPVVLSAVSDLLINLSAGWLAVAVIIPFGLKRPKRLRALTLNFIAAILFLVLAIKLRL